MIMNSEKQTLMDNGQSCPFCGQYPMGHGNTYDDETEPGFCIQFHVCENKECKAEWSVHLMFAGFHATKAPIGGK